MIFTAVSYTNLGHFYPLLIFASKAGAYPGGAHFRAPGHWGRIHNLFYSS
jgi:hypothetical protein